jgi:2-keto-4-pentenoate hydratase
MSEQLTDPGTEALARRLDEAWENRVPILPLTESEGLESLDRAYEIQKEWTRLRLERGERILGRKIGLTSEAMQEQLGVSEPDYGSLLSSRHFPTQEGKAEAPIDSFIQPRIEGELAFLIGTSLSGPGVTLEEVMGSTEAVSVAAGLAGVSLPAFVAGTAVGQLPWTVAAVAAGHSMEHLSTGGLDAVSLPLVVAGAALAVALVAAPVYRYVTGERVDVEPAVGE